ncbi:Nuclear mitotic apparatus protein 1 [Lemmus lemmus]
MQPTQIAEGLGISTRQQRKRVSLETHQGLGTPESKKATSCFPGLMTPRDGHEGHKQSSSAEAQKKAAPVQVDLLQSMAFSVLNTPKKLGNRLLWYQQKTLKLFLQRDLQDTPEEEGGERGSSREPEEL